MARQSVLDRFEVFIGTAVLAAHASKFKKGFRQGDVCWFIELFADWLEFVEEHAELKIQNTQVARYLDTLVKEGFARRLSSGARPQYRLTRAGLLEVGARIRKRACLRREYFFFVHFFGCAYRRKVAQMIEREGERFSPAVKAVFDELFDMDLLLDEQIELVTRQLKKLDRRLQVVQGTRDLVQKLSAEGRQPLEILAEVDRCLPFGLDQQRRYSEVLSVATEKQALWELTVGNERRVRLIWLPARSNLAHYLDELRALKTEAKNT